MAHYAVPACADSCVICMCGGSLQPEFPRQHLQLIPTDPGKSPRRRLFETKEGGDLLETG